MRVSLCVCLCVCVCSESLLGGHPDVRTRLLLNDLLHLRIHLLERWALDYSCRQREKRNDQNTWSATHTECKKELKISIKSLLRSTFVFLTLCTCIHICSLHTGEIKYSHIWNSLVKCIMSLSFLLGLTFKLTHRNHWYEQCCHLAIITCGAKK